MKSIPIFNRKQNRLEKEQVLGEKAMRMVYENPVGRFFTHHFLARPWLSKAYGAYQCTTLSTRAIDPFIRDFKIPMDQFEPGPFTSFNDFFIRPFKPGQRTFETSSNRFCAPAEGRYLVFPKVTETTALPVKGATLNGVALLGSRPEMKRFHGGPGFIARLCPVDYHRYHFPDDGKTLFRERLRGKLHSVNPIALAQYGDVLFRNERVVSVLETKNFGQIAYLEVGALCVGKIVESHTSPTFRRGDEKGYFLFGGSTVIVVGEPGAFSFDADLLKHSAEGVETLVTLGEGIASSTR